MGQTEVFNGGAPEAPTPPVAPVAPATLKDGLLVPEGTPVAPEVKPGATPEPPKETKPLPSVVSEEHAQKLAEEFEANGALSEESLTGLEQKGIPRTLVNQWVEGQKAQAESIVNKVVSTVGGQEKFNEFREWAEKSMSPEQKTALNNTINEAFKTRSVEKVQEALKAAYADFELKNGTSHQSVSGKATSAGPVPFANFSQLTQAQKDPRYRTDPAYRQEVMDRLAASNI